MLGLITSSTALTVSLSITHLHLMMYGQREGRDEKEREREGRDEKERGKEREREGRGEREEMRKREEGRRRER